MRSSFFAPLLASAAYAIPRDFLPSCYTVTEVILVPSAVETRTATAPAARDVTVRDLGISRRTTSITSTIVIRTLEATKTHCLGYDKVTVDPTITSYTSPGSDDQPSTPSATAGPSDYEKRALGLSPRRESTCIATEILTVTYGQHWYYVRARGETSTVTTFTAFAKATADVTRTGGRAYAIETAKAIVSEQCGPKVNAVSPTSTATITQDQRCAPSSLVSKAGGNSDGNSDFGIERIGTITGATFVTNTTDGSACCQQCAEAGDCATSGWDSRTGICTLYFTAAWDTGAIACGNQGLIAFYDAGPVSPLAPGAGLFVGDMCGSVGYASTKPDDGS